MKAKMTFFINNYASVIGSGAGMIVNSMLTESNNSTVIPLRVTLIYN